LVRPVVYISHLTSHRRASSMDDIFSFTQLPLVRFLREILGEELFIPPPGDQKENWLSPEALRGKYVIRTKVMINGSVT